MAKKIYLTEADVQASVEEFRRTIVSTRTYGNLAYSKTFPEDERTATIIFTMNAYVKMKELVGNFGVEVQWHGLCRRIDDTRFQIYDIIVPPHEITATTVTSDDEKYRQWLFSLDTNTFASMKFHGHSHVNMGVTPSAVDMKYRKDLVTQLPNPGEDEDEFYIFLIFNKKDEWSGEIYDIKNNALYGTKDFDIDVQLEDGSFLSAFITEAHKVAVPKPVVSYPTGYNRGYNLPSAAAKDTVKGSEAKKETKTNKKSKDKDDESDSDLYDRLCDRYGIPRGYGADPYAGWGD